MRVLWLIIFALLFVLGKNFLSDHASLEDLRQKNTALSAQISALQKEIARLQSEEERLTNDPEYIERRARSKLRMSKEGEIIVELERPAE